VSKDDCIPPRNAVAAPDDHFYTALMTDLFDAAAMYDEDYLHFFAGRAGPAKPPRLSRLSAALIRPSI
jgi:hypothetical protein